MITFFKEIIEELVNFGSHILKWDLEPKSVVQGDESIAPVMMFRHFLDILDSISLLTAAGSADTAKIQLRAAFETALGLEYLFEKNTRNRAMAYVTMDILNQIKTLKSLDPSGIEGKKLEAILQAETSITATDMAKKFDFKTLIAEKESVLQLPQYKAAYQGYLELKQKKVNHPAWYQYYNGPRNILGLASHLKKQALYELLYRKWSGAVHGSDVYLGKIANGADPDKVEIVQLRYFKDIQEVVNYTQLFTLTVFRLYVKSRIPKRDDEFRHWYQTNRDRFMKLNEKQLIIVQ